MGSGNLSMGQQGQGWVQGYKIKLQSAEDTRICLPWSSCTGVASIVRAAVALFQMKFDRKYCPFLAVFFRIQMLSIRSVSHQKRNSWDRGLRGMGTR